MKKLTLLLSLIILLAISGFFLVREIKAGSGDNVAGWAWSENIGWISFNCYNEYDGGALESHCLGDDSYSSDYGVSVDLSTGNFSGYAWSENIGWIRLNPDLTDRPGLPDYSACLDIPTENGENCHGVGDNLVSGWARACSVILDGCDCGETCNTLKPNEERGGWDGWIKLRKDPADGGGADYGVLLNTVSGEFEEWAWGSDVVGWVSFNCSNEGCGPSDYKVFIINQPPSATNLTVTEGNYCDTTCAGYPPIFLNWTFVDDPGDTQAAYYIQVDDDGLGFPSPEVNVCVDDAAKIANPIPGICVSGNGGSTTYAPTNLSYSQNYDWQLKIWDSIGVDSGWVIGPFFDTDSQPPCTDFDWAPPSPSAGEPIHFTDQSTSFGTGITSWAWDFDTSVDADGDTFPDNDIESTDQNPTWYYMAADSYEVKLTATDSNGSCPYEDTVTVSMSLPEWKEIAPTGWLKKLWASIFELFQL